MKRIFALALSVCLAACASTNFKSYEGRNTVFEGQGGTKETVNGIDIWGYGDPPRKYKVMGIIEDSRPGAIIPMAQRNGDITSKAKQAGGDAIIKLSGNTQVVGVYTQTFGTATINGNTAYGTGTSISSPIRRSESAYMVIKYLD